MTLLRRPTPPGQDGSIQRITPENAGWSHVGFEVLLLQPGQVVERATEACELCLVLVTGKAAVAAGPEDFGVIGERMSPFDGGPWSVYVPARSRWRLTAETACELAICAAPAQGLLPPRLIPPAAVGRETRGSGTNTRHVRNILPETAAAESLLVVEVITPGGHWSSYPPHKHDTDDPPRETRLEETYYHRLARPGGFAMQRAYTDDRSLDETMSVSDRDVVLIPRGYHPVAASHGCDLYYLNAMAGPVRRWMFSVERFHADLMW